MIKFLNINILKLIIFRILKPINPIDFDGNKSFEFNLLKKIKYICMEITIQRILNGESILKILVIIKETLIFLIKLILYPIGYLISLSNYRFLHINSWQIGAYVQQLDTIIKQNKLENNKYKLLFVYPKFLRSNNFFHNFYSKEVVNFENFFLYLILYPFIHMKICSINNWKYETINPNSSFNLIHKNYNDKYSLSILAKNSLDTKLIVKKFLIKKKCDLNKKIVCIQQRDEEFYSGANTRGSNLESFKSMIENLILKNFLVIHFKSENPKKLDIANKENYIELQITNEISKKIQFSIISESELTICYQGGIHSMNQIVHTPFLQINSIPININGLIKKNDKIIFKKFFCNKEKKLLSLKQMLEKNLHLYVNIRSILKHKVDIIENSEEEIVNAIDDILFKKNGNLQDIFRQKTKKISFFDSEAKVAESFLDSNRYLLNE